jgi:DNA primase (bacterial type)
MKNSNYISIRQYLENKGINPAKDRGYYGMYYSPLREDTNPSFKVDFQKNLWYDFGISEGGSIVDLVMKLEKRSLAEALQLLDDSFSFHRNSEKEKQTAQSPQIKITGNDVLCAPSLFSYLHKRCIDTETAMQYCREIHYTINEKPYYAIGFQNDAGGYELRNEYFKGSLSLKDITSINQKEQQHSCYVFEGFMDYLSFLVLRNKYNPDIPGTDKQDYIILNSVHNVAKAIDRLGNYDEIHCFLDNDIAGQQAFLKIRQKFDIHVRDSSKHYAKHKDLNDYLCEHFGRPPIEKPSLTKPYAITKKRSKGRGL